MRLSGWRRDFIQGRLIEDLIQILDDLQFLQDFLLRLGRRRGSPQGAQQKGAFHVVRVLLQHLSEHLARQEHLALLYIDLPEQSQGLQVIRLERHRPFQRLPRLGREPLVVAGGAQGKETDGMVGMQRAPLPGYGDGIVNKTELSVQFGERRKARRAGIGSQHVLVALYLRPKR